MSLNALTLREHLQSLNLREMYTFKVPCLQFYFSLYLVLTRGLTMQ